MNNLTDMDNLSTNRAAKKLVDLALISFLGACHNGTDVDVLRIHFLSAWIIFSCDICVAQHNTESGCSLGHLIVRLSPVILRGEHVTTHWHHSRLFSCAPAGRIIPFLATHRRRLHSSFADLHTPLQPKNDLPKLNGGEISVISHMNVCAHINRNASVLHVLFLIHRTPCQKKKKSLGSTDLFLSEPDLQLDLSLNNLQLFFPPRLLYCYFPDAALHLCCSPSLSAAGCWD